MSAFDEFWKTDRWTREYNWRPLPGETNPYTLGYHIGQDIGGGSWYATVPALRPGKVVRSGRSSVIGGYVVVQADEDGLFDGYAHLNTSPNNRPGVGERVGRGSPIGKLARSVWSGAGDDYTGSGSTGPHLHFTVSYKVDNSWNPQRGYDLDPRPFIRTALRGPEWAGGGAQPFDPEEEMPFTDADRELLRTIGNTLTGGNPGVKFEGEVYGMLKSARDHAVSANTSLSKIEPVVAGPINRAGGRMTGTTDLKSVIAWSDENNLKTRDVVTQSRDEIVKRITEGVIAATKADPKTVRDAVNKAL